MAVNSVDYGFISLAKLMNERVNTVGVETARTAIMEATAEYNRIITALLGQFTERTTMHQERYELPGAGTLQPLDEWGNPLPVVPSGYYDVAYPIYGAGTAWGDNRISRAMMTMSDVQRNTEDAFRRDTVWLRRQILASIFTNTTRTFADKRFGNLTVQPLANGDTVTYVKRNGDSATDNHYLGQAAAIADATNPYPTIYAELDEHPSNSGPYIAYIATNLVSTTEALAAFIEPNDPSLILSLNETRLMIDVNPDNTLTEGGPVAFGDRYVGRVNGVHVVEWSSLPSNYIIAHATGAGPFLKMREYDAAEIQGFFPEMHSPDGNLMVNRFLRYCGFGVANRVAALAMEIEDASYDIPTGFTAPLPN